MPETFQPSLNILQLISSYRTTPEEPPSWVIANILAKVLCCRYKK